MKQFVITIPNPIRGKGAKGFDRRPQEGEPTFSVFHCYADNEKRAREITASSLDMRKVPDGTKLVEIASDPRVNSESFTSVIFQGEEKKEPMQHPVPASSIKRYEVTSDNHLAKRHRDGVGSHRDQPPFRGRLQLSYAHTGHKPQSQAMLGEYR